MENKYYTPTIEEFYVGFEYEHLTGFEKVFKPVIFDIEKMVTCFIEPGVDSKGVYSETTCILGIQKCIQNNQCRVKYLDKEDIQSLGWEGHDDYYTHSGGRYKLVIETFDTYQSILIESLSGFKYYNYLDSIKNKSELKKLMQQLGIYGKQ